jgi:cytochrome b subunit of formate dehydrogenase
MSKSSLIFFLMAVVTIILVFVFFADPFLKAVFLIILGIIVLFMIIKAFSGNFTRKKMKRKHHNKWAERVQELIEDEKEKDFDKK